MPHSTRPSTRWHPHRRDRPRRDWPTRAIEIRSIEAPPPRARCVTNQRSGCARFRRTWIMTHRYASRTYRSPTVPFRDPCCFLLPARGRPDRSCGRARPWELPAPAGSAGAIDHHDDGVASLRLPQMIVGPDSRIAAARTSLEAPGLVPLEPDVAADEGAASAIPAAPLSTHGLPCRTRVRGNS
jgi:hypothetical protein